MPGGFATGLAKGIFGQLSAQRRADEQRTSEEKQQVLKLLGGLVDQADPESKPLLLRHIGDVIGLKGQQKGIWGRLTGADIGADSEALRGKLSEVLGSVRGPEALKQATPKPTITGLSSGPGGMPVPTGVGQTLDRRDPRAIYLRDPLETELEKIRIRGETQARSAQDREAMIKARQAELQEDRQKFEAEMLDKRTLLKAEADIRERAAEYGRQRRSPVTDADMSRAADEIGIERGLNLENLRARTGLAKAKTAESQATVNAQGQLVSQKPMTPYQSAQLGLSTQREGRQRQQDAEAAFNKYNTARTLAVKLGQELQAAYKKVEASPYSYDAKTGKLYNKTSGQELTPEMQRIFGGPRQLNIETLGKLQAAKDAAMEQMSQIRQQIGSAYGDYFDVGGQVWDVRPKQQQAAPAGGPVPSSTPTQGVPRGQGRIGKVGEAFNWASDRDNLLPGDPISVGQSQFKVLQRLGSAPGGRTTYLVKRIR
jgi:hypothetical protein